MRQQLIRLGLLCFLAASPSLASAQPEVLRIDEDWELVVTNPDVDLDAPQVTVVMAPFAQKPALSLQVNLNHALDPDFVSGGIQVRIQNANETIAQVHRKSGSQLSSSTEVVTWTSSVQKNESGYTFGVLSGNGTSWSNFGGSSYFVEFQGPSASGALSGYDPARSVENSGATYAGNRVTSLQLKRFRLYYANDQFVEFQLNTEDE